MHRAPWPTPAELLAVSGDSDDSRVFREAEHLLGEIRRQKSLHGWKVKTPVHVVFEGDKEKLAIVRLVEHDIRAAVTAVSLTFRSGPSFAVIVEAAEVAAPTPEPRT